MPRSKPTTPKMPTPAQMRREDRKFQAERMVTDGMRASPQFKQAVKAAERHLEAGEKAARKVIQKGGKK